MILEDMPLLYQGLPPMRCKRAERETVARMQSKPVAINQATRQLVILPSTANFQSSMFSKL